MRAAAWDRHPQRAALDLLTCALAFGVALAGRAAYAGPPIDFWLADWAPGGAVSAGACFLALTLSATPPGRRFFLGIENSLYACGLALLAQFAMAYAFEAPPIPLEITIFGVLASAVGIASARAVLPRADERRHGVLIAGFSQLAQQLAPALGEPVVGVLESSRDRVPEGLPYLGDLGALAVAVEAACPARVIVSDPHWRRRISPELLLELRRQRVEVEDAPAACERVFRRVAWQQLPAIGLLFSASANASRAAMAWQSVYTNLLGLLLLLAFVPLLIAVAIESALFSRGGPALESIECTGFGEAPFHMLRFGAPGRGFAPLRRLIARLRLRNLPRIINVLRGEMVLFGPPPVRRVFAERLSRLIPVYPQRFTVKPGIFGWSQTNMRNSPTDEALRLQYDLYYIKRNSPELELEIVARAICPGRQRR